jgi:UDP-glucose 4-epimerase
VLERLRELAPRPVVFERASVCDEAAMAVFQRHRIDAVVHFAAFKAVGESTQKPLDYYANNLGGLLATCPAPCSAMACGALVFSSSATVYGDPQRLPITEDAPLSATNPYGQTKLIGETILRDLGAPTRLADRLPALLQPRRCAPQRPHRRRPARHAQQPDALRGPGGRGPARAELSVYGDDYPTPDGTGVRDYIHVEDLAEGHVAALRRLLDAPGSLTVNLGTGRGYSVLEVVRAFERASGRRPSPTASWPAARATWPPATPTRRGAERCWAGAPATTWTACAPTAGAGNR